MSQIGDDNEKKLDPDVEIMYLVSSSKPVSRRNLKVNLSPDFNKKPLPEPHETNIEKVWQEKIENNPKLWNGTKFRIASVEENANGNVIFNLGITDYKEFIGTNWAPNAKELHKLGDRHFGDIHCYMSDALGVGALVKTIDEQVILLRRSHDCGEAVGLLDIPGGHPEPKTLVGKLLAKEIDLTKLDPNEVVEEIFNSTLQEICDEVNIPLESLSDPVLLGIARNTTSAGRPSSEYYVRCSLTSEEVKKLYQTGSQSEAEESTSIVTVPMSDVSTLQFTHPHIWNDMAPSAKGCFTLYRWTTNLNINFDHSRFYEDCKI